MSKPVLYQIHEEPNEIDDHLLDIIGGSFNFDHVKGLAEWLKNSVDAYRRAGAADSDQFVVFRFAESKSGDATMECVDFVGMDRVDIDKALKRWGDPEASKRGGAKDLRTYGGHGNGGKFYMRQMFDDSYYITYKNGMMNVFGFSRNKKYGFAEGYKDKKMSPAEAMSFAGLDRSYIPKQMSSEVMSGKTGFTVVRGIGPATMKNMPKVSFICNHLVNHPQAQRILNRIPTVVVANETIAYTHLSPDRLKGLQGFDDLPPIQVPKTLTYQTHHDRVEVEMANQKYEQGKLTLSTSEIALEKVSKYGDLNRIDIIGELGVIASYRLSELGGVGYMPQSVFVYGECECPILEDPSADCVTNDRTKLIENPMTTALLEWIGQQVRELCQKIAEKQRVERERDMKDISSTLNSYLNDWKDKYMSRILAEILASPGQGPGIGFSGTGGTSESKGTGQKGETPGEPGKPDNDGGGDTPTKGKRSPKVLLSDLDPDPFPPYEPITLSDRQPAVYQRPQDVDEGIYWINTSAPLARSILGRYSQDSSRFRDYLFQRYVDIFIKEALLKLEKRDPGEFNAANVEQTIGEVVQKIHEAATKELSGFLFEEDFNIE